MAAVLDRPDPLGVQGATPTQQLGVSGLARAHGLAASQLTRERIHRGGGVGRLVWVRSNHDHPHRPSRWIATDGWTAGRQASVGATPRSYQVMPVILGEAAGDKTHAGQ